MESEREMEKSVEYECNRCLSSFLTPHSGAKIEKGAFNRVQLSALAII